ncbi:MAG TPA: NAD(P)H-quinone oxidoreductase [Oligoflexia bacterium]|nr:NAD(P)H-quinone oxidoreductase [Oligoflexia bacterium]HMP48838.1 NAD(P)H-quinone oxidoreductase [Oligoflexia bacterium]
MSKAFIPENGEIKEVDISFSDKLKPLEILIEIKAAGVNRADILQVMGKYNPPSGSSNILGLEFSGVVKAKGDSCTKFNKGSRVCGLVSSGAYAEEIIIEENLLMALPDNIGFEEGASIPESWITAYFNLFEKGGFARGEKVLIHSAAGGVGLSAVQLLKDHGASSIIASLGNREKSSIVEASGASDLFFYKENPYQSLKEAYNGKIDLILDTIGKGTLDTHLNLCNQNGRIILIGLLGGNKDCIDLGMVLSKNIRLTGSTLRNQPTEKKIELIRKIEPLIMPSFSSGKYEVNLDKVFSFKEIKDAHRFILENKNVGNVVLKW